MKNNLIRLFSILLVLFSSCDKKTPDPGCKAVSESSQAFLDYWHFPEGSWWVYELKGSPGIYDTVKVTEKRREFYKPCKKDCGSDYFDCTMTYFTTLTHTNSDYFFTSNNHPANERLMAQGNALRVIQNVGKSSLPNEYIFSFPVKIGLKIQEYLSVADTNQVITPLKTFKNSVHIKVHISPQGDTVNFGNFARSLYFTKNVGFTKRVYTGNHTWELVNYHIVK